MVNSLALGTVLLFEEVALFTFPANIQSYSYIKIGITGLKLRPSSGCCYSDT